MRLAPPTNGTRSLGRAPASSSASSSSSALPRVSRRDAAPAPATDGTAAAPASSTVRIAVAELNAYFGAVHAVRHVSVDLADRSVTAIIGPSGCGKSTFLRCLNRMHETVPTARVDGRGPLDGHDIYGGGISPGAVGRQVGMGVQR